MLRYYRKKIDSVAIMFMISLFVLVVTLGIMVAYFAQNKFNRDKINKLNTVVEQEVDESEDKSVDRYAKIRDKYPDLVGFVTYYYYNNKIKLPLMQTKDNDYYLYRDVEGNESKAGTPFIDYRCNMKDSLLLILYAHNMKDLSQFGALKEYKKESYRKSHPYIYYESMYEKQKKYEVVSAFYSEVYDGQEDVFRYYAYFDLENKATYDYYLHNIRRIAEYDTGIRPEYGDRLIVLSTCDYTKNKDNGRFAVLAREVIEVEAPMITKSPFVKDKKNESKELTTKAPTVKQTKQPIKKTKRPTIKPTVKTTLKPSGVNQLTNSPTIKPTPKVTNKPVVTQSPTNSPSIVPTEDITQAPIMPSV